MRMMCLSVDWTGSPNSPGVATLGHPHLASGRGAAQLQRVIVIRAFLHALSLAASARLPDNRAALSLARVVAIPANCCTHGHYSLSSMTIESVPMPLPMVSASQ